MLEASSGKRFIIGAKQVKNAIMAGKASKVYVASDCDDFVSEPVIKLAKDNNLEILYISTRKELGEMCKINIKASCAVETIQ